MQLLHHAGAGAYCSPAGFPAFPPRGPLACLQYHTPGWFRWLRQNHRAFRPTQAQPPRWCYCPLLSRQACTTDLSAARTPPGARTPRPRRAGGSNEAGELENWFSRFRGARQTTAFPWGSFGWFPTHVKSSSEGRRLSSRACPMLRCRHRRLAGRDFCEENKKGDS